MSETAGRLLEQIGSPGDLRALPEPALEQVCAELREEIVSVCGRVGGHLGASLGAVELIVALHRIFKTPHDKVVFDVGHQAYAHKLLTGRRPGMSTLRQEGGTAPFLDREESRYDAFGAGHACTAVSAALGLREGMAARGDSHHVVAVLGDGALTGGLTFEALNNAGVSPLPLVIVLNDNQMSISANVGAVSKLLRRASARTFFESMGFTYLGPVDGHSLPELLTAFREARRSLKPVVVHALTQKGKGFDPAEADVQTRGHAMGPYELRDGKLVRSRLGLPTFSDAFAQVLEAKMAQDPLVVAVTPAMLEGSALVSLKARFPDRVFDVGIAEQHAVTFSAGLAAAGLRPVCCIYSTFLQRAYDSLVHDVCLQRLPVVLAVDRAGLVGADGATHQGAYDLAFMRPLPNLAVLAPVFGEDLAPMLDAALASGAPAAIRFPRGTLPPFPGDALTARGEHPIAGSSPLEPRPSQPQPQAPGAGGGQPFRLGTARWLRKVSDAKGTVISLGPIGLAALEAAKSVGAWNVLDVRCLAPLDEAAVLEAAATGAVILAEEGTRQGGLGSAVLELLAARDIWAKVRQLGLPARPVRHGDARVQRAKLGLDAEGIAQCMRALVP